MTSGLLRKKESFEARRDLYQYNPPSSSSGELIPRLIYTLYGSMLYHFRAI